MCTCIVLSNISESFFFFFRNSKSFKTYNNKKVAHKQFCKRPPFWYLRTRPGWFVRYSLRFFDYHPSLMPSDIVLYHFLILKALSFFYVQHQCCIRIFFFFFSIFVECLPHGKIISEHFMKSNSLALDRYLRRYSEETKKILRAAFILQVTGMLTYYCTKNPGVVLCRWQCICW